MGANFVTSNSREGEKRSTRYLAIVTRNCCCASGCPSQKTGPQRHCEAGLHAATLPYCLLFPTRHVRDAHAHRSRFSSPKVRCRGVVSLSWDARRGRARSLKGTGGAGASSALKKHQAAQEQEQKQAASSVEQKSPSRSRRIVVAKVLRT